MSHTTRDTDVAAAIERSRSHDEIVTIMVTDMDAARRILHRIDSLMADIDDEAHDYVLNGDVIEIWGYPVEPSDGSDDRSDEMAWRVHAWVS